MTPPTIAPTFLEEDCEEVVGLWDWVADESKTLVELAEVCVAVVEGTSLIEVGEVWVGGIEGPPLIEVGKLWVGGIEGGSPVEIGGLCVAVEGDSLIEVEEVSRLTANGEEGAAP